MKHCFESMLLEIVDIAQLKPFSSNARAQTHRQIQRIAGSIKQFGFTNPLLIDECNEIIVGHGRLQAAQRLKLEGSKNSFLKSALAALGVSGAA